jgi:hypothetical protein
MTSSYEETIVSAPLRPAAPQDLPTEMVRPAAPLPASSPGPVVASAKTEILGGPPPSFAWLVIREGPRAGQIFRLHAEGTSIGRDSQCDIILDDDAASRQHARLRTEKNGDGEAQFFLYDLATANGTKVNGQPVVKQPLSDGDLIEIGRTRLVFKQL